MINNLKKINSIVLKIIRIKKLINLKINYLESNNKIPKDKEFNLLIIVIQGIYHLMMDKFIKNHN